MAKEYTDEQLVDLLLGSGERAVAEVIEMFKEVTNKQVLVGAISMYMSHLVKAFNVDPQLLNKAMSTRRANKKEGKKYE